MKYIIEVEDKPFELLSEDGFTSEKLFRVKGFNSLVFDWNGLSMLTPYTEPDLEQVNAEKDALYDEARDRGYEEGKARGYQEGLFDAWEVAKKIELEVEDQGFSFAELNDIFGIGMQDIFKTHTAAEAIAKIKAWEEKQKIKVGDEVDAPFGKAAVFDVKDDAISYLYATGETGWEKPEYVKEHKTGRNFPEIAAVFEKMKKE